MTHVAHPIGRALLATVAVFGAGAHHAAAATFTADLQLSPATGQFGQYLTASYDLGVRLADVESVRLELNIPWGFEGTAATTGNSSWTNYLLMQIHDPADPPPPDAIFSYLTTAPLDVPPSTTAEIPFIRPQIGAGWEVFFMPWPDFLSSGAGAVSFIDVHTNSWHPLPDYEGAYSTTSWVIPDELLGARLIIEGTAIPEPAASTLLGLAIFCVPTAMRSRRAASPLKNRPTFC